MYVGIDGDLLETTTLSECTDDALTGAGDTVRGASVAIAREEVPEDFGSGAEELLAGAGWLFDVDD